MDRGAWSSTVHEVSKSQRRLTTAADAGSHFGRLFDKTKHTLNLYSTRAPWHLPKGVESLCPHKKPKHGCL